MDFKLITVGIADLKSAESPDILRTILGSCVGICLYDSVSSIGGLSHIMLPAKNGNLSNEKKYADSAIPLLLKEMEKKGAKRERVVAKIAGGAKMFNFSDHGLMSKIGDNNVEKVKEVLEDLRIRIIAEDVGGANGRTIDFYLDNGSIKIKSPNEEVKLI